jgi:hypothetical protein
VEAHIGEDKMDIEGHIQGPRGDHKKMNNEEMDKELNILMLQW